MLKKRLLVLTPRYPYPAIGGDKLRILHVCRALRGHFALSLLSLCETREEMRHEPADGLFAEIHRVHLPRWRSYMNTLRAVPGRRPLQLAYYDCREFRHAVDALLPQHHAVLAHLIRTGQYIEDRASPRILEMTDAISMNYSRLRQAADTRSWMRWVYMLEQKRLERYEKNVAQRFDKVWLTSHTDRGFLDPEGSYSLEVIPNGADLEHLPFRAPTEGGDAVVFIGNMVTLQNQDACHWFAREVLLLVRKRAPLVFRIVGNAPEHVRRQFARYEGVEMTGRIEHIRDGVDGAFCAVCPLRAAAGIQNKVLEYLALGLPCVTTPLGLGGIEARPGREALVFHSAAEAAEQILTLHANAGMRIRLASAGRELTERAYDWKRIYGAFVESALEVAGRAAAQDLEEGEKTAA